MRHQKKKIRLHRKRDASRLLLKSLASSLVIHEKIQTTRAKAKVLQPVIEKLISIGRAKEKSLTIRTLNSQLGNEFAERKIMEVLSKRYIERKSGFTRITPIKFRVGDAAPIVQIELLK